jgi:putative MATE family efflux protein
MTLTGAIGLMAMFAVDLADLWFISRLGRLETTAGIGFAGTMAFANLSVALGLGIAAGALVAIRLGQGRVAAARRLAGSALAVAMLTGLLIGLAMELLAEPLLRLLGAGGPALAEAAVYLRIVALGFPLLAGAIVLSFALRAAGDPVRAMMVTLVVAATNAALDPLFIFGLDLGIAGAALATISANLLSFLTGWHGLVHIRRLFARPTFPGLRADMPRIAGIAVPAVLTQLATPFLVAYTFHAAARFGDGVVAAMTIVNRLVPVFFGVVFSLSGAVGPIIGQNFGARRFARVRRAYAQGLALAMGYAFLMAGLLFIFRREVPGWFAVSGEAAALVTFFCTWLSWAWMFTGGQFVAQAAFNNLGHARLSTLFNWGRATLGTILPVEIMARLWGAHGLFAGAALGSALAGLAAMLTGWWLIRRMATAAPPAPRAAEALPGGR